MESSHEPHLRRISHAGSNATDLSIQNRAATPAAIVARLKPERAAIRT